jgi:hypothetical protein
MNDLIWFFGRGASIACGLDWDTSNDCKKKSRDDQIKIISDELPQEMNKIATGNNM